MMRMQHDNAVKCRLLERGRWAVMGSTYVYKSGGSVKYGLWGKGQVNGWVGKMQGFLGEEGDDEWRLVW